MYKIIEKLPDDVKDEDVEVVNMTYNAGNPEPIVNARRIDKSSSRVEAIYESFNKNFSNAHEIIKSNDVFEIVETDLDIETPFYFFDPRGKHHIYDNQLFLQNELNKKYFKIKYTSNIKKYY